MLLLIIELAKVGYSMCAKSSVPRSKSQTLFIHLFTIVLLKTHEFTKIMKPIQSTIDGQPRLKKISKLTVRDILRDMIIPNIHTQKNYGRAPENSGFIPELVRRKK